MESLVADITYILASLNEVLSSAIIILAFSLFVYMFIHSLRSSVGRIFAALLACMCFTYAGDVALFKVDNLADAIPWLKFQWIGIAFIPAVYLHFADALLRTTNAPSSRRRFAVGIAYFFGFLLFERPALTVESQRSWHSLLLWLSTVNAGLSNRVFGA